MRREDITAQAKLIAALAETMSDRDWASEILQRCQQIKEAVRKIEAEASSRQGGER